MSSTFTSNVIKTLQLFKEFEVCLLNHVNI